MPGFADFIAEALAVPAAPGQHRYLIVDAAATRPTHMASELACNGDSLDILTGERCDWRHSASPVLIGWAAAALHPAQVRKVRETALRWKQANCFVYLDSPYPPDAVARVLRHRTDALLPQDMPVLLRYFDPRVFAVLLKALRPEQASTFLRAGTRWAFPGRRGELTVHEPASTAHSTSSDTFGAPLRLSEAQEAALIDAAEADAMVDLLLNQNNDVLLQLLPADQHEQVRAALQSAAIWRIDRLADQVAFCALALRLGPGFVASEPWASALPRVQAGRLSFSDVLARVAEGETA